MKTLNDLFVFTLKDIYFAEKALLKALPKMARNTTSPALSEAFLHHREETLGQIERLEQVFQMAGQRPKAEPCEAIKGLIEEAEDVIEESDKGAVRDAGLLACGQCVEHYEMGRYGALIAWADVLGMKEASGLLKQNLEEEKAADTLLSKLAKSEINRGAATPTAGAGMDEDGGDDRTPAPATKRRASA